MSSMKNAIIVAMLGIALTGCYKPLDKDEYRVLVCNGPGYGAAHLFTEQGDNHERIKQAYDGVYLRYQQGAGGYPDMVLEIYVPKPGESCKVRRFRIKDTTGTDE